MSLAQESPLLLVRDRQQIPTRDLDEAAIAARATDVHADVCCAQRVGVVHLVWTNTAGSRTRT